MGKFTARHEQRREKTYGVEIRIEQARGSRQKEAT